MIEAVAIALILALVAQQYFHRRDGREQLNALAARDERLLEQNKHLADQIVLLKVEPQIAAIQAVPEEIASTPAHITITDDEAIADYEQERRNLSAATREFIEQYQPEAAAS